MTVYYRMRQILLQNATEVFYKMRQVFFSRKCASFITKYDSYYKLRRFCYKMQQLLQNATFITNFDSTTLNYDLSMGNIFNEVVCIMKL